jgi:hypothetical protein
MTRYDASIFGILANVYYNPLKNELTKFIEVDETQTTVRAYLERIKENVYPDWTAVTEGLNMNSDWKAKGTKTA